MYYKKKELRLQVLPNAVFVQRKKIEYFKGKVYRKM